jgi:hypothetical protein
VIVAIRLIDKYIGHCEANLEAGNGKAPVMEITTYPFQPIEKSG